MGSRPDAVMEPLPCGCQIGTTAEEFVIEPCSTSCPNYLYAVAETKRQGKPIELRSVD